MVVHPSDQSCGLLLRLRSSNCHHMGHTRLKFKTYTCIQKKGMTNDEIPSSRRLGTILSMLISVYLGQPTLFQKQWSQMHVTSTRESFIIFCVPWPPPPLSPWYRMSLSNLEFLWRGSNAFRIENIHMYPKNGRTNDLKPSSPRLRTNQGQISHAFETTVSEMKVYLGLPNFVSNNGDPKCMWPTHRTTFENGPPIDGFRFRSAT